MQQKLIKYANAGESFPFVPKHLVRLEKPAKETKSEVKIKKLPSRPLQRTKLTIEQLNSYEREQFRPNPSKTRSAAETERLQNIMAFGKEFDAELRSADLKQKAIEKTPPEVDLFAEILEEIEERREFLDDMEKLGVHKKYLPEIQSQITLRLRELEKLNKDRAQEILQYFNR
ncbi:UPF0193 protein EVG1-like [Uloborus diversus]|uniref:UPF0193 protein EVG1-like n=1 Tax=Uloborus diversus TaxID=327109 RepID=UPI00240A347F|nr:UPF0193 protein EVG1-like [Uloborus diversus]